MDRHEFESGLKDFEMQVRKKLPSMINIYLANKGNREQETAFDFFVDTLQRHRKNLLKSLSKVAKSDQKIRYFNTVYSMDSQLRSMGNRYARSQQLKLRQHKLHAPIVYDIGEGPEEGDLLNINGDGLLLKTTETVSIDHEIRVSVAGKKARGKAIWSLPEDDGGVETGVKLTDMPDDFMKELKKVIKDNKDKGNK